VAQRSPTCAERKNASGHSRQRLKGRLRQLWGNSGSRPSSFVMCNSPVEVQLPQPGVSIIRAAPQLRAKAVSAASIPFLALAKKSASAQNNNQGGNKPGHPGRTNLAKWHQSLVQGFLAPHREA